MNKKQVVISLSGGMDSTTLVLYYLHKGYDVLAISFNYGQKHLIELEKAIEFTIYMESLGFGTQIKHHIIKLEGLSKLLNSSLVSGGNEIPEGHYKEDNMKQTVVPNRNKIFSSIIQSIALSLTNKNNSNVVISLGIHAGDHDIYPDCRAEFRDADNEAFKLGNWDADKIEFETPFIEFDKYDILRIALEICNSMGINFDEVFKRTNTSYKPINGISDYKSASSVERIEAFIKLGRKDPIEYANDDGSIATWEEVKDYVNNVLSSFDN